MHGSMQPLAARGAALWLRQAVFGAMDSLLFVVIAAFLIASVASAIAEALGPGAAVPGTDGLPASGAPEPAVANAAPVALPSA